MSNETEEQNITNIHNQDIREIARQKYLDYAMSVIVERALPDVRDGLKPVHRRILYSMYQMNLKANSPYKKSARVVGDVIGKYHPHGDSAVYDTMVRMAQGFSMRSLLVDGQGNFGSIDGDSPAAMRYTECRMNKIAEHMFKDINLNTVDFNLNYDGTESEPSVLPLSFPNLVVNGVQGIAVGMASNIPPHNPIEALECVKYLIECKLKTIEPDINTLLEIMPAPDFPTRGILHGSKEMINAFLYGRAKMKLRSRWHEEDLDAGRTALIIDELPYQVNKAQIIKKISELATPNNDRNSPNYGKAIIEGIFDVQDESDKEGIRIFIGIKSEYDAELVFNQLIKQTLLEDSISYNATVLINGQPKVIGLLEILQHFINHRLEVIERRTQTLDNQAAKRQHILNALILAIDPNNIDKVISIIRKSTNTQEAKQKLCDFLEIDEEQSTEILNLRLQKLTSMQIDEMKEELNKININRDSYYKILSSLEERLKICFEESDEQITHFVNQKEPINHYGENHPYAKRLTEFNAEIIKNDLAALTKEEDCRILMSHQGYMRRLPVDELEIQNRGTRGKKKMQLHKDDFLEISVQVHSHENLVFISDKGKTYSLMAYEIPDLEKGRHIRNILEINEDEKIIKIISIKDFDDEKNYLTMITKQGIVKKTQISEYKSSSRKGGIIGINLHENDYVVEAFITKNSNDIVMINNQNKVIRFSSSEIRSLSRNSYGVTGMKLDSESYIIGGDVVDDNGFLICISNNGLIKITKMEEYRNQKRSGKGVFAMKVNERTGELFKAFYIEHLEYDVIITTKNSIINRISLENISVTSRNTSGVNLIKLDEDDFLIDVSYSNKNIDSEIE